MSETVEAGAAIALLGERALVATEVFRPGGVRVILDQIKASVAAEKIDVSTPAGREHCRSLAFKIARSKTALDGMGKTLSDEWRKRSEAIHTERRLIERELDALRDRVRAPLTAYEEREKKRVQEHEDALTDLRFLYEPGLRLSVEEIDERLARASTMVTTRTWEEFQQRASELFAAVNDALNGLRATTIRVEAEKAEAARLQAEREEQARLQTVREQEAREARLVAEAAEQARRVAFARAQREATEAAQKAERERQAAAQKYAAELEAQRRSSQAAHETELARVQAEERAKAQAAADRAREEERERVRVQQEADRVAAELREKNVAHHRKINGEARDAIVKVIDGLALTKGPAVIAVAIVTALAKREIPHCKIEY